MKASKGRVLAKNLLRLIHTLSAIVGFTEMHRRITVTRSEYLVLIMLKKSKTEQLILRNIEKGCFWKTKKKKEKKKRKIRKTKQTKRSSCVKMCVPFLSYSFVRLSCKGSLNQL